MNAEFVDTNVIVYAYDKSDTRKQQKARALLEVLWESKKGRLSIQVLQELYVVLTKKAPAVLSHEAAASIIADLGMWDHHSPGLEDLLEATRIQKQYGINFWDAMIVTSASRMGCKVLWTEDLNHGKRYEGIEAINPFKKEG